MKKLLFFVTLSVLGLSLEAAGKRPFRGFGDSDGDDQDYLYGYGGGDQFPYSLERRGGSAAKIKTLKEMIDDLEQKINKLESSSSQNKDQEIAETKAELKKYKEALDAEISPEAKSLATAIKQGMSRALLGRGGSVSDAFHLTVAQALAYNMLLPMKKVIIRRSETMWDKAFDKIESLTKSFFGFFGLTSTISAHDIMRWKTNCESLALAYKELRKGVESSESRSTSLQLRSIMSDDDEDDEVAVQEIVVDKAWEQKRRGDVIMLEAMIAKLQVKRAECSLDDIDILASLDRLLCEVEGLRDQIMSANNLRDLVDADRANLMTGYFASIDSALVELGMVIAPEEFDETKTRRKKQTGYGYDSYGAY